MPFSSLFGLEPAVRALQKALEKDQVAGTYLFVGPPGVGKVTLAQAFAEATACLNPRREPFDACGACESCLRARARIHPEILQISPAGDQMQIWQFWDRDNRPPGVLQHTLTFAPTIGRKRVYILERADTLNEAAANSLLKVLEEPPPYALFVLLAPHTARMLPTILSRAQIVRLMPVPVSRLADYLAKTGGIEPARARTFAAYAEGRTGTALELARNPAVEAEVTKALDLGEAMAGASPLRALKLGEAMRKLAAGMKALVETEAAPAAAPAKAGGEGAEAAGEETGEPVARERAGRRQLGILIDLLATVYQDILAVRLGGDEAALVHGDRRARFAALAACRPPEAWMACLRVLMLARRRVDQNASVPLLTDWLAMTLVNT